MDAYLFVLILYFRTILLRKESFFPFLLRPLTNIIFLLYTPVSRPRDERVHILSFARYLQGHNGSNNLQKYRYDYTGKFFRTPS
jgi:hypothetical protein